MGRAGAERPKPRGGRLISAGLGKTCRAGGRVLFLGGCREPGTGTCQLLRSRGGKQPARCFRDNPRGSPNRCQVLGLMNKQWPSPGGHVGVCELRGSQGCGGLAGGAPGNVGRESPTQLLFPDSELGAG